MRVWSRLRSLWRRVASGRRFDRELNQELSDFVEMSVEERVRNGETPVDARRAALMDLAGMEQVKEAVRDERAGSGLDALARDVRYGLRQFLRAPTFTATAIAALALGIGATAATFSVVDSVLLRPLAYPESESLVMLRQDDAEPASPLTFFAWQERASAFELVEAAEYWVPNMSVDGNAEKVVGLRVTGGMFRLLGVEPQHGRVLTAGDEDAREVVLSYGLFARMFGARTEVIGTDVLINGEQLTIVGVMPRSFVFPTAWAARAQLWAPLPLADRATNGGQSLRVFGRLADDASLPAARDEMTAIAVDLAREDPGAIEAALVTPLKELVVGDVRQPLVLVFVAVGLVLVVACANVAHMLLARATAREREVAVRAALGASQRRLVRQFLTESVMLSLAGGLAGLGLAWGALEVLRPLAAADVPRIEAVVLNVRALGFVLLVSMTSGIVFGLAPILKVARPGLASSLGAATRGSSAGQRTRRVRSLLMVSEVALTATLLIGAGLMLRSFVSLRTADPGWNPEHVTSMILSVTGTAESPAGRRTAFYQAVLDDARQLPGVVSVSAINHLPLAGDIWTLSVTIDGAPTPAPGDEPAAAYRVAFPGYFETMDLALLEGRTFADSDRMGMPLVAVVNQHFAETHWPGDDAIGRRFTILGSDWVTVVGVVENTFLYDWASPPAPEVYLPYHQSTQYQEEPAAHSAYMTLVARTAGDADGLESSVRGIVRARGAGVTVSDVIAMSGITEQATAGPRFLMALLAAFAGVALLLAAVGIYGVISYDVASRLREIAIRLALGASPGRVLRDVVSRTMLLVASGALVGVALGAAVAGLLAGSLYGVSARDPLVYLCVPIVILASAMLACALPAWRASGVEPRRILG